MYEIKSIPREQVTFSIIDYEAENTKNSFNLKDFEELSRQIVPDSGSTDESPDDVKDSNIMTTTIDPKESCLNVSETDQDNIAFNGHQAINFKDEFSMFTHLASKLNVRKNTNFIKKRKQILELVEKEAKCNVCGRIFKDRKYIHNHKRFVHGSENYKCDQCDFTTKRKVMLKYHTEAKHNGVTYDCTLCDYKACRPYRLKDHMNTHENVHYKCTQCEYSAKRPGNLNLHIKAAHENNYKFSCDKCQFKCMLHSKMKLHIETVHEKVKHNCSQCAFKSTSKSSLRIHFKSKHLGIFHYCDECTYKATSIAGLNRHKKTCHS